MELGVPKHNLTRSNCDSATCYLQPRRNLSRACEGCGESPLQRRQWKRLQSEWKMAKMALIVILLFVLSWAPYSTVALVAFAG